MCKEKTDLWESIPGDYETEPTIEAYIPEKKISDAAVIVFAGGGYSHRADHEGPGYAELFHEWGITSFVVNYRINEYAKFPNVLLDARRAVQFVRYHAGKYGIDRDKIAVIGSSAGGHLVSQLCTYTDVIDIEKKDEMDGFDFLPNYQVLCYPVIDFHLTKGTTMTLYMGIHDEAEAGKEDVEKFSADYHVTATTPPAFIWHTADDGGVDFRNSFRYASALQQNKVSVEMHIFPEGNHGQGKALNNPHLNQWTLLLKKWFELKGLL